MTNEPNNAGQEARLEPFVMPAELSTGLHKCFHRYTSQDRADMQASHRLGYRQKQAVGEHYWTHELIPMRAFPTRKSALGAALRVWQEKEHERLAA